MPNTILQAQRTLNTTSMFWVSAAAAAAVWGQTRPSFAYPPSDSCWYEN